MKPYIVFEYADNKEKIIYINAKQEIDIIQVKLLEDSFTDTLGTCLCSILNSKDNVKTVKQIFNEKYSAFKVNKKTLVSDTLKIIKTSFDLLQYVNPYFMILYNDFFGFLLENESVPELNNLLIEINKIYDGIIETITMFEELYSGKSIIDSIYLPPAKVVAINGKITNNIEKYAYEIHNLDELLGVSCYLLNINNYHIKRCKFPECNKFFQSKRGQSRYCYNPSPYNEAISCMNYRRTVSVEGLHQTYWEKEIDFIQDDVINSRQFLRDHIQRATNKRNKEMLKRNHSKFCKIVGKYKLLIKGATDENRRKSYLKDYKQFIKEVRDNQINKNPPILKIKSPNFLNKNNSG